MTATAAEALELALWLHRAPIRRAALLARPLPDGIGQLLRVAGGAPDQVAAAARITGEDEGTILEAVRFYLQQILFHDEADAYRVLGLRQGAPPEQAREHHRLLQQWLHPDRRGSDDWESVYATRINSAWSHLRTPNARTAYDATLADTPAPAPAPCGSRHGGEYKATPRPVATGPIQPPRNRPRNLTFLVLLACLGLLVLIALRQERPPQWQDFRPSLAAVTAVPEPEQVDVAPIVATLGAAMVDAAEAATTPAVTHPAPRPAPTDMSPPVAAAPVVAMPLAAPVAAPPARAVRTALALPEPVARLAPRRPQLLQAAPPDPVPERPAPAPATPAVSTAPAEPILVAAAEPVATAPAKPAPLEVIPDAFERMNEARRRADLVLAYLADPTAGLPPVWNDVPTLREAQRIHAELHDRLGAPRSVRVELHDPRWSLTPAGASLASRYRTANEQGRVGIEFTWREGQWLVRAISLVPDA